MLGPGRVDLAGSTSAADADVCATLVDVYPDGYSQLVHEGIVRLSRRGPDDQIAEFVPGQVYDICIGWAGIGHRFRAGHRIGLEIAGSSFDRWDRNPHPGATTVHHGPEVRSAITLPIAGG